MRKSPSIKRWTTIVAVGASLIATLTMPYTALADSSNTTGLLLNSTVNATLPSSNSASSSASGGVSIGVGGNKTGSTGTSVAVGGSVGVSTEGKSSNGTTASRGKTGTGATSSTSGSGTSHASGSTDSKTSSGGGKTSGNGKVSVGGKPTAKARTKTSGGASSQTSVGTKTHGSQSTNGSGKAGVSLSGKAKAGGQAGAATQAVSQLGAFIDTHNPVQLAAYNLESTLSSLGISQTDYLYAYLQTVPISASSVGQLEANANAISGLFANLSGGARATVPPAKLSAAWNLIIQSWAALGIQTAFQAGGNASINIQTYTGTGPVSMLLKDHNGTTLGTETIPTNGVTPPFLKKVLYNQEKIGQSITTLRATGNFVPAPYGTLPRTGTQDLLMVVIGGLVLSVGVAGLIRVCSRRRTRTVVH